MFRFLALACFAVALTGCGGGGGGSTPATPNASSTVVTVEQSNTTPVAGITVTLSTALAGNSPEGVITTQVTNASGVVTFNNLPSTGQLCVSATTGSGNSLQATGTCLQPFPATLTLAF